MTDVGERTRVRAEPIVSPGRRSSVARGEIQKQKMGTQGAATEAHPNRAPTTQGDLRDDRAGPKSKKKENAQSPIAFLGPAYPGPKSRGPMWTRLGRVPISQKRSPRGSLRAAAVGLHLGSHIFYGWARKLPPWSVVSHVPCHREIAGVSRCFTSVSRIYGGPKPAGNRDRQVSLPCA